MSPGFIDMHGHTDHYFCIDPQSSSKISQGVTTEVCGNCGYSPFLLTGHFKKHFQNELKAYGLKEDWKNLASFSQLVTSLKPAMNWMTLVGSGTLRLAAMNHENRTPNSDELKWMKHKLEKAMDEGAVGLSSGLIYTPGCFAKTDELVTLAKIVSKKNGIYATHMRSEGDHLLESVRESIRISRQAKLPLEISHLKTAGEKNWGKIDSLFELLEKSILKGDDITWDRYPYAASFTSLDTYLPKHLFNGGDLQAVIKLQKPALRKKYIQFLDNIGSRFSLTLIANLPGKSNQQWIGRTLAECALLSKKSIGTFVIDLLCEEKMQVNVIFFSMSEENMDRILLHPKSMIGSDASARSRNGKTFLPVVHPRTYGTFPKFLKRYVFGKNPLLSLEEAIYKMTGFPAQRLGLKKRGLIDKNFYADLVLFNPKTLKDRASFQKPTLDSTGIKMVLVNGKIVLDEGKETNAGPGIFIRHGES
ncbi:MAG: amidohydrolase family protein [Chlamydiae bacterium]|nr:amidohydrolase family protein [Chlamydiota bacterium]MBI3278194.1 amidohydrolase family protein [Chlamydiota bacterium]